MILKFGDGKISVAGVSSNGDVGPEDTLLIEDGKGTGIDGPPISDRLKGMEVDLNALSELDKNVVMLFKTVESVDIVIGILQSIRNSLVLFKKSPTSN